MPLVASEDSKKSRPPRLALAEPLPTQSQDLKIAIIIGIAIGLTFPALVKKRSATKFKSAIKIEN